MPGIGKRGRRSSAMATINISLPDKMKQWVEEEVATGRYANANDLVRDFRSRVRPWRAD